MTHARSIVSLAFVLVLGVSLAACQGCHSTPRADTATGATSQGASPTLRLYAISNMAGALEPCGCTKDQLGGIDHLAAFIAEDRKKASSSLVVAAGPTMFLDPKLDPVRGTQDKWKGEAISDALADIGLAAWTPGFNDWAGGGSLFATLAKNTRAPLLAANLGSAPAVKSTVVDAAGVKVGIAGVSTPSHDGAKPEGVDVKEAAPALKAAAAELRRGGAKILIGLASVARGEALRLAEMVPELAVLIVGKPSDAGDLNDAPPPPVLVGNVLVIGTSNHLQTVGVVDFFVQGSDFKFQDATGVANAEAAQSVAKRIRDLENRLAAWEGDPSVRPEDVAARKSDLARLREEKARLSNPPAPKAGSYFRYALVEVRSQLGADPRVEARMKAYYRQVNDHNKVAFADRKPPEPLRGESGYAGVEACTSCHEEARTVWNKTAHARAYATLSEQFKEYNLECVSCHVTGYEKPGGSTVTMNALLRDVQCEECHGPGKAHAKSPKKAGLIVKEPRPELCVSACHHPPHVESFDPVKAKALIVGPGHGMPEDAPWPAWARDAGTAK